MPSGCVGSPPQRPPIYYVCPGPGALSFVGMPLSPLSPIKASSSLACASLAASSGPDGGQRRGGGRSWDAAPNNQGDPAAAPHPSLDQTERAPWKPAFVNDGPGPAYPLPKQSPSGAHHRCPWAHISPVYARRPAARRARHPPEQGVRAAGGRCGSAPCLPVCLAASSSDTGFVLSRWVSRP